MSNRYNTLLQDRYVSTYVPLPLDQISDLAKDYTDRYNTGKNLPKQFDLLSEKIKEAPIHKDLKHELITDYKSQINNLVQNAKPEDYAKPEYQDKINNLTKQFANDPRLNDIQNTKQWWDKEYVPYKNDVKKNGRDLDYTTYQDAKGNYKQIHNGVTSLKVTPYENRYKTQEDVIGNIKDSGYLNSSGYDFNKGLKVGPNSEYQAFSKTTNGYTGLTDTKLQDVVNHSVQSYGNTNDGKHHLQEILKPYLGDKAYNLDYNSLKNLAQNNQDAKDMLNHVNNKFITDLFNVGYKQIGGVFKHDVDNKELKDDIQSQKNKDTYESSKVGLPNSIEGPTLSFLSKDSKDLLDKGILNKDGNIDMSKFEQINKFHPFSLDKPIPATSNNEDQIKLRKVVNQAINTIGENNALNIVNENRKVNGLTPYKNANESKTDDYNGIMQEYFNTAKVRGYNGNQIEGSELDALTKVIKDHPNNFEILDEKLQPGTSKTKDFKKEMYNDKDYTFKPGNRVNIEGKSYIEATLTNNEDGNDVKTVYIRPDKGEYQTHFDEPAKVAKAINDSYSSGKKLEKVTDKRSDFYGANIRSEVVLNNKRIIVYEQDDKQIVTEVGKDGQENVIGKSFKEYQQNVHPKYSQTNEGKSFYGNIISGNKGYSVNVDGK